MIKKVLGYLIVVVLGVVAYICVFSSMQFDHIYRFI